MRGSEQMSVKDGYMDDNQVWHSNERMKGAAEAALKTSRKRINKQISGETLKNIIEKIQSVAVVTEIEIDQPNEPKAPNSMPPE